MHRTALVALPAALATLVACVADVGEGHVAATVEEAPAPAAAPVEAPTGTALAVDPARSSLRALGAKITATHPIDFPRFTGSVTVDGDTVTGIAFEVDMASLESDHPKLTSHLKNADFFDVGRFPKATFRSTEISAGATEAGATHTVKGDLTIRGTTKRVGFPATVTVAPGEVEARTEFVIDRKDFGVVYPGKPDDLVQDNVRMTIAFVAPRA